MNKWIGISFILIFTSVKYCNGQAHVQTTTKFQNTAATTIACTFAAASTSGDLIVVHLDYDNQAVNISTVTDNKGNHYSRINGPTPWNGALYMAELWYAYNITGGAGAITITGTLSGAPSTFSQIYISEYSGVSNTVNPLDQNSVAIGSTAAVSSGAKTTQQNNELIYGASIGASGALTKGAGFTARSVANQNIIEDKNAAAAGSYSTTFTSASGNWVAQMATFTTSNIVLSVDLQSFTGNCNHSNIVLNWATSAETNADYFSIEESPDGTDWKVIGTVKSVGNSSITQNYSFTAQAINSASTYFRLKQTDLSGNSAYFKIIQVANCISNETALNIYPNPCNGTSLTGKIGLQSNEIYSVDIFDNLGKMVEHFSSVQEQFSLNFSHTLPTGVYYARFSSPGSSMGACFLVRH